MYVPVIDLHGSVDVPYTPEMKRIAQQAYDSALSVQADKYICHR